MPIPAGPRMTRPAGQASGDERSRSIASSSRSRPMSSLSLGIHRPELSTKGCGAPMLPAGSFESRGTDLVPNGSADDGRGIRPHRSSGRSPHAACLITLGTSGAGGWVLDPSGGAAGSPPVTSLWGVPVYRDPWWPAAQAGTALIIDTSDVDIYIGQEYRIDVSSEAGTRFDQNISSRPSRRLGHAYANSVAFHGSHRDVPFLGLPPVLGGRPNEVQGGLIMRRPLAAWGRGGPAGGPDFWMHQSVRGDLCAVVPHLARRGGSRPCDGSLRHQYRP